MASLGAAAVPLARGTAAAESYTLRLNISNGSDSAMGAAALRFASAVKSRSNGQVAIELYPNLQLAKEAATIDGLSSNVIDLGIVSAAFLAPLFPNYDIFTVPFLFKDSASGFRVLDGPIGSEFFTEIESKGIVGLGWGSGGFKEIETSSKAVVAPEDLKGLRIRIPSGAIYVATYQALGAIPVPIDVSETFTALTQKTVDGMDVNLDVVATGKYFTVVKHVALSHHVLSILPLMMSKRKYDALGPPLQKILREEAHTAVLAWRERIARETATTVTFLKTSGVAFTEIQYPAFKKAVEPVYATLQSKLGGDMLQRVSRAAG